ncbi:MAG: DNA/RNA non-specific endonuclease [Lachnospiraceae bacterium]|nr:DNA/RNA non-specific endonuclease [Lachnospiraceae bacterium]
MSQNNRNRKSSTGMKAFSAVIVLVIAVLLGKGYLPKEMFEDAGKNPGQVVQAEAEAGSSSETETDSESGKDTGYGSASDNDNSGAESTDTGNGSDKVIVGNFGSADSEATGPSVLSAEDIDIPPYSGEGYIEVNGNEPFFNEYDFVPESFETYSELDDLGRCGQAYACVGEDLMPTEKRGDISEVKPTGWHQKFYDGIVDSDPPALYNRSHLIAYSLTAENANERNLITGTRYFNAEIMEPFEAMTVQYINETGDHVLYRVTPFFEGDNLVADGVLMEAASVEDGGEGYSFCVFCYNVQPGVIIDYRTGKNKVDPDYALDAAA